MLDGFIENKSLLKKQLIKRKIIEKKLSLHNWSNCSGLKKIVKRVLNFVLNKNQSYEKLIDDYNNCISYYTKTSNRITLMTHMESMLTKYWCYKNDLNDIVYVPFENIVIPIPKNYDSMLKNMYGNYMEYPPIEKRGTWHEGIIYFDPSIPYKEYFKNLYDNDNQGL